MENTSSNNQLSVEVIVSKHKNILLLLKYTFL